MQLRLSLLILGAIVACDSSQPESRSPLDRDDALATVCPAAANPPAEWKPIALAQLGGRICANDESLPEWKSGLRIYHRGGPDDVIRVRDAYIAAAAAAGWTKVNIEEKKDRGAFSVVLHRADDSKGIVLVVASSAGFVRVNAQRSGWEDQVRQRDLENSRKVEESLDRAQSAP